jgi:hypothetical protein
MQTSKASRRRVQHLALLDNRLDMSRYNSLAYFARLTITNSCVFRRWNNELITQNRTLRAQIEDLNLERRQDLAMAAKLAEAVVKQRAVIRALLDGMDLAEAHQMTSLAEMASLDAQFRDDLPRFYNEWGGLLSLTKDIAPSKEKSFG